MTTCGSCFGAGKVSCSGCGGRGSKSRLTVRGDLDVTSCFQCGGSGRMRCGFCGGTGKVGPDISEQQPEPAPPKRGRSSIRITNKKTGEELDLGPVFEFDSIEELRRELQKQYETWFHAEGDKAREEAKGTFLMMVGDNESKIKFDEAELDAIKMPQLVRWLADRGWITPKRRGRKG